MTFKANLLQMEALNLSGFKAYDVRGKIGEEISPQLCYLLARALASYTNAKKVVVGCDNRLTSQSFKEALILGFQEKGCQVLDLGQTGTEEVYFGCSHFACDAGVQVTASHNPKDYNGLKIVSRGSVPMGLESGLDKLMALMEAEFASLKASGLEALTVASPLGTVETVNQRAQYFSKLQSFFSIENLKNNRRLKILFNIGNGTAGSLTKYLCQELEKLGANLEFSFLYPESDGNFPHGIPNPLLVENRQVTAEKVRELGCDLGVAFDGDFDRCFFFDEAGNFIDGYYVCGLLAQAFCRKNPGATLVYEPRLLWNTKATIEENGGVAVISKSGHSYIKRKMREVGALYGGENSAHHYFKDYFFCDSGMIPWLLVVEMLQSASQPLSALVKTMQEAYPCTDELNFKTAHAEAIFSTMEKHYRAQALDFNTLDGMSFEFKEWRFNIRSSNTEPLVRLNIESRGDKALLSEKKAELLALIEPYL